MVACRGSKGLGLKRSVVTRCLCGCMSLFWIENRSDRSQKSLSLRECPLISISCLATFMLHQSSYVHSAGGLMPISIYLYLYARTFDYSYAHVKGGSRQRHCSLCRYTLMKGMRTCVNQILRFVCIYIEDTHTHIYIYIYIYIYIEINIWSTSSNKSRILAI
jgi:hypothetical protein